MSQATETRICTLFANPTKAGGTYFSGKTSHDVTIPAGARSAEANMSDFGHLTRLEKQRRMKPLGERRRGSWSANAS
jgi:hypothetical protein